MVPPKNNPPPILVDVFNACIKQIVHPTFPDGGDSIVHRIMLTTLKEKMQQSKVISSALPLYCSFDNNNNSVQQTTHNDDVLIWASKCQSVAFTPITTSIWMSLALQILPLINNTPQSAASCFLNLPSANCQIFSAPSCAMASF